MIILLLACNNTKPKQISSLIEELEKYDSLSYFFSPTEKIGSLKSLIATAKKNNDNQSISNAYRRLSIIYSKLNHLDSSELFLLQALDYSKQAKDVISQASNLNQIGVINYYQKRYTKAIELFSTAKNFYLEQNDYRGAASTSSNIAECYSELNKVDSLSKYAKKSLIYRTKANDRKRNGYSYFNIGNFYNKVGKRDSALAYYKKSLFFHKKENQYSGIIQCYNAIGKLEQPLNKSILFFDSALQYSQSYYDYRWLSQTYGNLSRSNQKAGNLSKSLALKDSSIFYKDLFLNEKTQKNIETLRVRYQTREKERKITDQQNHIEKQYLWLVIFIILSVVILLIGVILFNKRRAALKKMDTLIQTHDAENIKAKLDGQDEERKRISKELHDNIAATLSTVQLYFENIEDGIKEILAGQNKSYTKTIGLLEDAVNNVRDLSHELSEGSIFKFGYSITLKQLIVVIEQANNNVKVDFIENDITEISYRGIEHDLYRITQELLSNTLKYANAKQITIQVSQQIDKLTFMYEDDGKGFTKNQTTTAKGIGYKNIEARVAKINGTWFLDTQPNHGMTLTIEIPLKHEKN